VEQNVCGGDAHHQSIHVQGGGVGEAAATEGSGVFERWLGIHWVGVVDVSLGWNEDQFGLGTGNTQNQQRYHYNLVKLLHMLQWKFLTLL